MDFGATFVTGIHVSVVHRLRQRLLGDKDFRVKVCEPYQMLGEVDDQLREALGIDVVGSLGRKSMFGTESRDWKELTLFDGTPCLVPGSLNLTPASDGGWYAYPEGDTSAAPSGHMPRGGHFFDAVIRQDPIDEAKLNPADNTEEFGLLSAEDLAFYRARKQWFQQRSQFGSSLVIPGTAFGDIALVPAPWMKHPKGIRDVSEWYMATADRKDYVRAIFDKQLEFAIQNVNTLIDLFGDVVQVVVITGTDFGTQMGPFIAPEAYREMFQPYHKAITSLIHKRSNWKCFIHSCGAVRKLIPDFIDSGFDVLNPVQCSAVDMDAARLKQEFGKDIVFWGGGVDTQKTMAFGTPAQVYGEVSERVRIFNKDGGFVFNAVHNVQGNTPIENVEALFKALRESK